MRIVYMQVNPDKVQAEAEAERGPVQPIQLDPEDASEFCLPMQGIPAPVSEGTPSEPGIPEFAPGFLEKKMGEFKEHVKGKPSAKEMKKTTAPATPVGTVAGSAMPERTIKDFLDGIMIEMSADSFWKDLMKPIEKAVEILQAGNSAEDRKLAVELLQDTKDQCAACYLFQDEQRILGAAIEMISNQGATL